MWVFGYGSLMWRPDFDYVEKHPAIMFGAHRRLCIRSYKYRGTPEKPGLVLGLDYGGSCVGMAFKVDAAIEEEVRAYLHAREMVHDAYIETHRTVRLRRDKSGEPVSALCYLVNRDHEQYAGHLSLDTQAHIVRNSSGGNGPNKDYVHNTCQHLRDMGIRDRLMEDLLKKL